MHNDQSFDRLQHGQDGMMSAGAMHNDQSFDPLPQPSASLARQPVTRQMLKEAIESLFNRIDKVSTRVAIAVSCN